MRVLGFTKKWPKLQRPEFTTFRYVRNDKNWFIGEEVQLVFHPRHKDHELLGIGRIISIELRILKRPDKDWVPFGDWPLVTDEEAIADGFASRIEMLSWLRKTYGRHYWPAIQKITIRREDIVDLSKVRSL